MSTTPIDYTSLTSLLLSSDPPAIPFDVTFRIFDQEKELQGEVPAHKINFALNSPVFRSSFCGAGNFAGKNDKEVDVTGSLKAFRLMRNFIYNKPTPLDELTLDEIFEVVDLAHCYDVAKLEQTLEQLLENYLVTKDSVIEVAKTAEEFARFEMASRALLRSCAKTLQKALPDTKAFVEFCSQVVGTGDEAVSIKLFAMMKDLQPLVCPNCQESPCLSGTGITTITQARAGTRLAYNPNHPLFKGLTIKDFGRTEVVSVNTSGGTMRVKAGEGSEKFTTSDDHPVIWDGISIFCFAC